MATRFRAARLGALVAVVLAALLATAIPAAAAASGVYTEPLESGHGVQMTLADGSKKGVTGHLYGLKLDGSGDILKMYCVEIDVNARHGAKMDEVPWTQFPGSSDADPSKVLWVLHHSYPNVDLADLAETIGVDSLDVKEALTGTQAAVWHFANGATLSDDSYPKINKLYDYLTGSENEGITEQPPATLDITPAEHKDVASGEKAGPFTIDTNAKTVDIELEAPDGVKIVDKDGNELTEFVKGTEFWLTAPDGEEGGTATVKAEVQANVEKARLFVGKPKDERTQSFVVATSERGKAKDEVVASWTKSVPPTTTEAPTTTTEAPATTTEAPAPTTTVAPPPQGGNLPETGSTILPVLGAGLLLVGAGVGLVLLQRRRRSSAS